MTSTEPESLNTMYTFDRPYHSTHCSLPMWTVVVEAAVEAVEASSCLRVREWLVDLGGWWCSWHVRGGVGI